LTSRVLGAAVAPPPDAAAHFTRRLAYETDCSDVHADLAGAVPGLLVVDARTPDAFAVAHVPGARNLPHAAIDEHTTADIPRDALVVTYCWGPHCNGATKAAARFAALGFRVKEMLGGITGWQMEGYELAGSPDIGHASPTA
jgi:rhodanese-related sulfurtransferase